MLSSEARGSPFEMWRLLKASAWLPWLAPGAVARPSQAERAAAWQRAVHRAYPRLNAPSLCRPAGPYAAFIGRAPVRLALRGLTVLTDERPEVGALLELEVLTVPASITAVVKVEAVHENPAEAPARYDVALQVCNMEHGDLARLRELLQ